jgi:hypothetical protein
VIDLGDTVTAYTNEILTFDRWTAKLSIKEHLAAIESYDQAVRQFLERLRQLGLLNYPEAT